MLICLRSVDGCLDALTGWGGGGVQQGFYGPQSVKYLPFVPLRKRLLVPGLW